MLITKSRPETATIYQFPPKLRTTTDGQSAPTAPASDAARRGVSIEFGSSRYHDAAIQEERARKP